MNDLHKEISGYWDKDDLVTISRELLDPFDLAYDTKIVLSSIGLPMNVEEVKEHPFYINFYHEPEMGLYCGDDYIIIGDNESSKIGIHKKTGNIHLIEETPAACANQIYQFRYSQIPYVFKGIFELSTSIGGCYGRG